MLGADGLEQRAAKQTRCEYIPVRCSVSSLGHSIQAAAVVAKGANTYFTVPLTGKIHEGIRFNCKDSCTLLDKMVEMLLGLNLSQAFYFIADKYYCSGRFMKQLMSGGTHIITMMKKRAVAYYPPEMEEKHRGRPRKYGKRVKLFDLFKTDLNFTAAPMPCNEKLMIEYCAMLLFWKPLGDLAQFVFVRHPTRGFSIAMSTDITLEPLDIIKGYSLRFKIEVMFKQAVHQIGTSMYRFWLKIMNPKSRGSGDQLLHFAPADFKQKVLRKLNAYHLFIQLGFIAQGLVQYLSLHFNHLVWGNFRSWLRTIRTNTLPSEKVVAMALYGTYFEFLFDGAKYIIFKKFLLGRTDTRQLQTPIFKENVASG